jgi:hypothetical protein
MTEQEQEEVLVEDTDVVSPKDGKERDSESAGESDGDDGAS